MPNRLALENSPYLLQHAENPVDWYAWGPEAFDRARQENRPLLISIGYSACHWCHVMAHESFEDPATADLMNRLFVNVKVDREERPDVDAVYMEAVQAMTGQGGWPLNVFVTPAGKPFFGGTYFPPRPRHGLPSWSQVLESIDAAYRTRQDEVERSAETVSEYIVRSQSLTPSGPVPGSDVLEGAYQVMSQEFDRAHGGFGGAPKFPQPLALDLLLRLSTRLRLPEAAEFVAKTLRAMAAGGIYDQLGGGFHRYSVDAEWIVPHFEKMLYDNALLATVYLRAYQQTRDAFFRQIAENTLNYLLRVMRSPEGGFYSAEDADSEGAEGRYYIWAPKEVEALLDPETARLTLRFFAISREGNFEGATILTQRRGLEEAAAELGIPVERARHLLDAARADLLAVRERRVPPGKDTNILTAWNALAVSAFAEAGAVLGREDYVDVARETAGFLLRALHTADGLLRSYQSGGRGIPAFLEDYAYFIDALITLYEADLDPSHLDNALELARDMRSRFRDTEHGAFFDSRETGNLPVRPRSFYDNPIPSGNSAASLALLRLEALTGDSALGEVAAEAFAVVGRALSRAPLAFARLLSALDFYLGPATQIAIAGSPDSSAFKDMLQVVRERYLPRAVLAAGDAGGVPLLQGRESAPGAARGYVCRHFACDLPASDPDTLARQLDAISDANPVR